MTPVVGSKLYTIGPNRAQFDFETREKIECQSAENLGPDEQSPIGLT
jgi:hypothetical protein